METILEHNPTPQERKIIGIDEDTDEELAQQSQQGVYVTLYQLYRIRDDQERARHYLSLIDSDEQRHVLTYYDLLGPNVIPPPTLPGDQHRLVAPPLEPA